MRYFLMTGATGLLGRYLMRDLTAAGLPLAVIARRTRFESARQRVETAMATSERQSGRLLVRPVVLEGDISEPHLGLSAEARAWVGRHCGAMIHSAASLTFRADEPAGEPWKSNVEGTRHVIDFCRQTGIRALHHVSTAYVCGLRRGRILESELNVGQELGNDYEKSKVTAESEVLASDAFDQITVYRPSIIVGDSQTGFTTSYHGFYTPLRLVYSLLQSVPWETILARDWLGLLQLAGHERKNLVGVDWVSAAMTHLVAHPQLHGSTYHLTNPAPATTLTMREAMTGVLAERVRHGKVARTNAAHDDYLSAFREQMGIYQSYWSDDPQFDSTNTERAAPHLPCPAIDHEVMGRLVRFAIDTNFGWPREAPLHPQYDVHDALEDRLDAAAISDSDKPTVTLNLCVTGPGGGAWQLSTRSGRVIDATPGTSETCEASCYLASSTLALLVRGDLALEEAINTGRLVVAGDSLHPCELARLFRDILSPAQNMSQGRPTEAPQSAGIRHELPRPFAC